MLWKTGDFRRKKSIFLLFRRKMEKRGFPEVVLKKDHIVPISFIHQWKIPLVSLFSLKKKTRKSTKNNKKRGSTIPWYGSFFSFIFWLEGRGGGQFLGQDQNERYFQDENFPMLVFDFCLVVATKYQMCNDFLRISARRLLCSQRPKLARGKYKFGSNH